MTKQFNPIVDKLDDVTVKPKDAVLTVTGFEINSDGNVSLPAGMRWDMKPSPSKVVVKLQKKTFMGYKTVSKLTHYWHNTNVDYGSKVVDIQDTLFYRYKYVD